MKSAFLRNSQNQCQTALFSFDIKRVPVFRFTPKKGGSEILKKKIHLRGLSKTPPTFWTKWNLGDWDLGTAGYRIFVLKGPFVEIKPAIKSFTTL